MTFSLYISQHSILKHVSEKKSIKFDPPTPLQTGIKFNGQFQCWLNTYTHVHGLLQNLKY